MFSTALRLKFAPAPVLEELNEPSAVRTTASSSLLAFITASMTYGSPRVRVMSVY